MTTQLRAEGRQHTPRAEEEREDCVLVLAPVGRDGSLIAGALAKAGIPVLLCVNLTMLCRELEEGAVAIVITTEVFDGEEALALAAILKRQPPWSDIPVLLLSSGNTADGLEALVSKLGNVTVLERPLRWPSLLSALRTALRARQRQYQVRELLRQTEQARREAEVQQARITALNQRLQQAMTETHHRVKNNLQILAAMIDVDLMQDTMTLSKEELQRLNMHIHTLAAIHDLLTQAAKADGQAAFLWTGPVLTKLLTLLEQSQDRRIPATRLDDVRLPVHPVTSLALIANELISNALKYGRGQVEVSFRVEDHVAVLRVDDDGPGFPDGFDVIKASHTGLELVENLARHDLHGKVTYTNRPEGGGRAVLTMPLPDL